MDYLAKEIWKNLKDKLEELSQEGVKYEDIDMFLIPHLTRFLESKKPDQYGSCDFCGWAFDTDMEF